MGHVVVYVSLILVFAVRRRNYRKTVRSQDTGLCLCGIFHRVGRRTLDDYLYSIPRNENGCALLWWGWTHKKYLQLGIHNILCPVYNRHTLAYIKYERLVSLFWTNRGCPPKRDGKKIIKKKNAACAPSPPPVRLHTRTAFRHNNI
jgi:hypothetical protein